MQGGDRGYVGPVEFVGLDYCFLVPVGPVQGVFERGYAERVWQPSGTEQHQAPLGAVEIARRDRVQLGVHPVQPFRHQVQGESVGPFHVERRDHLAARAVHAGPFDFRVAAPVAPVQPPGTPKSKPTVLFVYESNRCDARASALHV